MEDLIGLPIGDVASSVVSETSPDGVYTVTWTVTEYVDSTSDLLPNTKRINMIVTSQRAGTGNLVDLEYIKHGNY